jgi:hypothetical protein
VGKQLGELSSHLDDLHRASAVAIANSVRDNSAAMGKLLRLDVDIREWEKRLAGQPVVQQLGDARRELGFAIYSAASAMYVHAYAGLRIFLELSVAAVVFSADELLRRQWMSDRADFAWRSSFSEDEGVWSKNFVQEFCPAALDETPRYAKTAREAYRSCSQFIHGKASARAQLPDGIDYSESVLSSWLKLGRESTESVLFLLYVRYGDTLLKDDDGVLRRTLEDSFGHLVSVRKLLGLPLDEESRRAG